MSESPGPILVPIERHGALDCPPHLLPDFFGDVLSATRALYARVGFERPWIGYLAMLHGTPVGTCGFKGPPLDGKVEIAYFTFPEFEGRGVGSAMAACLVDLTTTQPVAPRITAQTLPDNPPSQRILEKLGFEHVETLEHPEDGLVWEWEWRKPR